MTSIIYNRIKYRDDGRELVSWFEFVTIHMTFPCLNAWLTYALCYQISDVMLLSCPYLGPLKKGIVTPNWWCIGGGADPFGGGSDVY